MMFTSTLVSSTLFALASSLVAYGQDKPQQFTISTTGPVTQCGVVSFIISGGYPPYEIAGFTGCSDLENDDALFELGGISGNSASWPAALAKAGGSVFFTAVDATGAQVDTPDMIVQGGQDAGCLAEGYVTSSASVAVVTPTGARASTTTTGGTTPTTLASGSVPSNGRNAPNNAVVGSGSSDKTSTETASSNSATFTELSRPFQLIAAAIAFVAVL